MSQQVRENKIVTSEIHLNQWNQSFDELSHEKHNWQTKIEVIDSENGA